MMKIFICITPALIKQIKFRDMRYYLLIISIMLFNCNSNQHNAKVKEAEIESDKCFEYPSIVDSLHVQNLYDSARWYVYALYCDKLYQPKNDTLPKYHFGQLELRFF